MTGVRQTPEVTPTFIREATQEQVDTTKQALSGERQWKNTTGPVDSGPRLDISVFFCGLRKPSAPTISGSSTQSELASAANSSLRRQP